MGKHNGKARSTHGTSVGSALANRAPKGGSGRFVNPNARFMHTTDGAGLQSNLEANDLAELMDMAELANRDFTAERGEVIVISNAPVSAKDKERSLQHRREAEERNAHRLRIPRRPGWNASMTAEDIDAQERDYFVHWRRDLARLEEEEKLVMTPFEKNLEVWRQLWRVLERSHIVVQVVDARDPLMYRSKDMEAYARELHPSKSSLLLLNKADLLSAKLRSAWADHLEAEGMDYLFWSAKAAAEGSVEEGRQEGEDNRIKILTSEGLIQILAKKAESAMQKSEASVPRYGAAEEHPEGRIMVGLTGYPNVGKSSTINALFGSKKTTVSATPGKTKHFQTLNITSRLTLVDCPGLVLPKYAASKAEMVAAGVIPIDRLTDVRAPIAVIGERVPRRQIEQVYGIRLPKPEAHEPQDRPPTSSELLRAVAVARGWSAANGLPDETRAGRTLLKDYTSGKLISAALPPGYTPQTPETQIVSEERRSAQSNAQDSSDSDTADIATERSRQEGDEQAASTPVTDLGEADLDLLESLQHDGSASRAKRAEHKFQRKPKRVKGRKHEGNIDAHVYDGSAMRTGKHGGLVRVS